MQVPELHVVRWSHADVSSYAGRCLVHHSHRADVLRLRVLLRYGGLYLDLDVLSVARLSTDTMRSSFVIGRQDSGRVGFRTHRKYYGLCNAVMAAAPGAGFVRMLLSSYGWFRSYGRDAFWDEHSVRVPAELADRCPAVGQHILDSDRLYLPLWGDITSVYTAEPGDDWAGVDPTDGSAVLDHLRRLRPKMISLHLWSAVAQKNQSFTTLGEACTAFWPSVYGALVCVAADTQKSFSKDDPGVDARIQYLYEV